MSLDEFDDLVLVESSRPVERDPLVAGARAHTGAQVEQLLADLQEASSTGHHQRGHRRLRVRVVNCGQALSELSP